MPEFKAEKRAEMKKARKDFLAALEDADAWRAKYRAVSQMLAAHRST